MLEMGPAQLQHPARLFLRRTVQATDPAMRIGRGAGDPARWMKRRRCSRTAKFPVSCEVAAKLSMAGGTDEQSGSRSCCARRCATATLHNDSFPPRIRVVGPSATRAEGGHEPDRAARTSCSRLARAWSVGTLPQYGMDYWPANARYPGRPDPRVLGLVKPISVASTADARAAAARSSSGSPAVTSALPCARGRAQGANRSPRRLGAGTHRVDPRSRPVLASREGLAVHAPAADCCANSKGDAEAAMVGTDIAHLLRVELVPRFTSPASMFAAMSFATAVTRSRSSACQGRVP